MMCAEAADGVRRGGTGRRWGGPRYRVFVYGTLLNPRHVRALTGKEFSAREAVLRGFERAGGGSAYPYIVPREGRTVRGKVLEEVDAESLRRLDEYEGEGHLYFRRPVAVVVEGEELEAYTYVGDPGAFGEAEEMDAEERVEIHLARCVERLLEAETVGEDPAGLRVRTKAELLGGATEEVLHAQFSGSVTPHVLRYVISRQEIPSLAWLKEDATARECAGAYLDLIVHATVFNQIEERARREFRQITRTSAAFHRHMVSSLIALRYLRERREAMREQVETCGVKGYREDLEYSDYVAAGILAADALYEHKAAAETARWVEQNRRRGGTPLGAELEFSNLGKETIGAEAQGDPDYDCFYYFHDFDLMRRFWKLGGYRDDHKVVTGEPERSRGFLEFALGRYRIAGDLSKPATTDPWVLARLVEELVGFAEVAPHSMHVSIDPPRGRPFVEPECPEDLVCLLLLGGDLAKDEGGRLRERRIYGGEIVNRYAGLEFSRLNYHRRLEGRKDVPVVEFVFPRLRGGQDYEPLILALKGWQRAGNPMPLVWESGEQGRGWQGEVADLLRRWAESPWVLGEGALAGFLERVAQGLAREREEAVGHPREYAKEQLGRIEAGLKEGNRLVAESQAVEA